MPIQHDVRALAVRLMKIRPYPLINIHYKLVVEEMFVSLLSAVYLKGAHTKKDVFQRLQLPNGYLEAAALYVSSPDSHLGKCRKTLSHL